VAISKHGSCIIFIIPIIFAVKRTWQIILLNCKLCLLLSISCLYISMPITNKCYKWFHHRCTWLANLKKEKKKNCTYIFGLAQNIDIVNAIGAFRVWRGDVNRRWSVLIGCSVLKFNQNGDELRWSCNKEAKNRRKWLRCAPGKIEII